MAAGPLTLGFLLWRRSLGSNLLKVSILHPPLHPIVARKIAILINIDLLIEPKSRTNPSLEIRNVSSWCFLAVLSHNLILLYHSMTVRDSTRRESPDGHVLYIEELRRHLGVRTDASDTSPSPATTEARPEVLLIGHDMHGDFQKMGKDRMDLQKYFLYSGCVDTQVIIEDTGSRMGKSLSDPMSHYGLYELELKAPMCSQKSAKFVYLGAHCAGNDAVATLKGLICQTFDLTLNTPGRKNSVSEEDLPSHWFDKPLQGMNGNMILLAYDTEGVETANYKPKVLNRTSEHGFAWLRVADIAHIPPGERGENWFPFIRARHWINQDFRNFENRFYCIGNPKGFWPKYGKSQYYNVSEGPAPFHELFEELAGVTAGVLDGLDTTEEARTVLEQTSLGDNAPVFDHTMVDRRGKKPTLRGNTVRDRGNTPRLRGEFARGSWNMFSNRSKNPRQRGSFARGRGDMASASGKHPRDRRTFARGRGEMASKDGKQPALLNNIARCN